ncbi:MAG: 4'-phosphopantetheinyl transferase superfamily protein [Candidatus Cloacimonetes bacterium]|nr:4'-phosphopantetheinyl transferase superfamily protein [Candidatus Cloacimonadota bacterium]
MEFENRLANCLETEITYSILSLLPESKRSQIEKYKTASNRKLHYLGWQLLSDLLVSAGYAPEVMKEIVFGENGNPSDPLSRFYFSISYSYPFAFCVLADEPVGADIELLSNLTLDELRLFCHPDELNYLGDNPTQKELFKIWSGKEAVLKLLGTGFQSNPAEINTCGNPLIIDEKEITLKELSLDLDRLIAFTAQFSPQ